MRKPKVGLTKLERRIVKRLLADGWRNQDIQAKINYGRNATVNSARITSVKNDKAQAVATDEELWRFNNEKSLYDSRTGLNPLVDERLVKAREAMILAVRSFNDPAAMFKTEVFCVLSQIAWTYLLHDYYCRAGKPIVRKDGKTVSLSEMLKWSDVPISVGMKNNLRDLIQLRDKVEHSLLGSSGPAWYSLFQANCLNFDKVISQLHGDEKSLSGQLSLSLQFAQMGMGHLAQLSSYNLPPDLQAFNSALKASHSQDELDDLEYQFSVHYTITSAPKGSASINFVTPESETGKRVADILIKHVSSDELYPLRAKVIAKRVTAATGKKFTVADHTAAWRKAGIRPPNGHPDKKKTNSKYCTYHPAHGDYTYSEEWLARLIAENGGSQPSSPNLQA